MAGRDHKWSKHVYNRQHLLDILTDGSDQTGHGVTFLTVARSRNDSEFNVEDDDPYDNDITNPSASLHILARYALCGLPSPLARLASDQRYKLASTKAVFLPSLDASVTSGIAALLLSLSDAGSDKLVVVGPRGTNLLVDGVVDSVLGTRRGWPRVEVCEIADGEEQWWKVYGDENVVVHACGNKKAALSLASPHSNSEFINEEGEEERSNGSADKTSSSPVRQQLSDAENDNIFKTSVVYTFTCSGCFRRDFDKKSSHLQGSYSSSNSESETSLTYSCSQVPEDKFSFAVMPPGFEPWNEKVTKVLSSLPQVVVQTYARQKAKNYALEFILHTNPSTRIDSRLGELEHENKHAKMLIHPFISLMTPNHFVTVPNLLCPNSWDTGILIRSRLQTEVLRSAGLECAFPVCNCNANGFHHLSAVNTDNFTASAHKLQQVNVTILASCTSVALNSVFLAGPGSTSDGTSNEKVRNPEVSIFDRRKPIIRRSEDESKHGQHGSVSIDCTCSDDCTQQAISNYAANINQLFVDSSKSAAAGICTSSGISGSSLRTSERISWRDDDEISLDDDHSSVDDGGSEGDIALSIVGKSGDSTRDHKDDKDDELVSDENEHDRKCSFNQSARSVATENVGNSSFQSQIAAASSLDPRVPHLLILGTGCASPSPIRGSSGYALLFPTVGDDGHDSSKQRLALFGLIECGEGTLMSLGRYLHRSGSSETKYKGDHLRKSLQDLSFIWISHAHLDHYSDLPLVVSAAFKARKMELGDCLKGNFQHCQQVAERSTKRRRTSGPGENPNGQQQHPLKKRPPVIVIAPRKVLAFLDACLECRNGVPLETRSNSSQGVAGCALKESRLFWGVTHWDFDRSSYPTVCRIRDHVFGAQLCSRLLKDGSPDDGYRPISFMQSIPVEHCPDAHALLLGLNFGPTLSGHGVKSLETRPFSLCFSGDARPSDQLVRACRDAGYHPLSLLIHEATFNDDEKGRAEAVKKRHSTVTEAVDVGRRMRATACLLTHFSGRYPRIPPSCASFQSVATADSGFRGTQHEPCRKEAEISSNHKFVVGCAVDGLAIPLTSSALSALCLLDLCFATIFSQD